MVDVVVIGGGPAGLQGALTLARGQRKVVVLDAGPPRNARAVQVHNFVTRDGVPPRTFRELAQAELRPYGVEVRAARATDVVGEAGGFEVRTEDGAVAARRVLLALGMVDALPDLPGLAELWGDTVFQCPYCHGHEVRGQRWAVAVSSPPMADLAVLCRAWTEDLIALVPGPVDPDLRGRLERAGVRLEERPLAALTAGAPGRLGALVLADGTVIPRDALILRPPQHQVALVQHLGLACDEAGYLAVDAQRETSRRGIYAAGDLTTPIQSAILAAASGSMAAAMINHALSAELAGSRSG